MQRKTLLIFSKHQRNALKFISRNPLVRKRIMVNNSVKSTKGFHREFFYHSRIPPFSAFFVLTLFGETKQFKSIQNLKIQKHSKFKNSKAFKIWNSIFLLSSIQFWGSKIQIWDWAARTDVVRTVFTDDVHQFKIAGHGGHLRGALVGVVFSVLVTAAKQQHTRARLLKSVRQW